MNRSLALTLLVCACDPYKVEFPGDSGEPDDSAPADDTPAGDTHSEDCDESNVEELGSTWYADADADGWGVPWESVLACDAPDGYTHQPGDCDDTDPAVTDCPWSGVYSLAEESDAVLIGEERADQVGWMVGAAGDVNGDGIDDALVATNQTNEGWGGTYLALGPVTGTRDLSEADAVFRELGWEPSDRLVRAVSGLGDLDGDGYDELSVGDYMESDDTSTAGALWLWSGPVTGEHDYSDADLAVLGTMDRGYVGLDPAVPLDVDGDGTMDLVVPGVGGELTGGGAYTFLDPMGSGGAITLDSADLMLHGTDASAATGSAVAGGDFDGDGLPDMAVGARDEEVSGNVLSGAIYVLSGPPASEATSVADADAAIRSAQASARLGEELISRGDLDGDGYDDLVASAPWGAISNVSPGALHVYSGPFEGALSSEDATATLGTEHTSMLFYSPFDAGDINLDGAGDIVFADQLGARYWGQAVVVYGPVLGVLAVDEGDADALFEGDDANASLVVDAAIGGDLNQDGWPDLIVGTAMSSGSSSDELGAGRAHILSGGL